MAAGSRLTIDQRLEKLGRQRELVRRVNKIGIICIVAMFGIAFLTLPMSLLGVSEDLIDSMIIIIAPLLFLSFILPLVGYFAGMWVGVKEKVLASRMTPHILEKVMDHLEVYDAYKALDTDYIKHADLGLPHYDRIRECQDYTKGVFRGIPLEFGEFTLEEEQTERDEDGDTKTSYVAVFSGLMVVCQHKEGGLLYSAGVIVAVIGGGFLCAGLITLKEYKGHIKEQLKEGKVHVAVNSGRDHFEAGSLEYVKVSELLQRFRDEIRYVTDLIDALLTVDTLYKQQEVQN